MSPRIEGLGKQSDMVYGRVDLTAEGKVSLAEFEKLTKSIAGTDEEQTNCKYLCIGDVLFLIKGMVTHRAFYEEISKEFNGKLQSAGLVSVLNYDGKDGILVSFSLSSSTLEVYGLTEKASDLYKRGVLVPALGEGFSSD